MEIQSVLRIREVLRRTGVGRTTLYGLIKKGQFSSPISLSSRAVGWPETEIAAINAARIAGKSDAEIRQLVLKLEADRKTVA